MKKKKRIISTIIIIISLGLLIFGLFLYYDAARKEKINELAPGVKALIKEKKDNNYKDKDDNKIDVQTYVNQLPDFRNQYNNPNIMGRLEIPNLNINALVTRFTNNSYYLENNLYNQRDGIGAPFFDYRNTDLKNNRQINIYGHNTQNPNIVNQLPFINLEAYTDANIFNNYKDVYLSIDEAQIKYRVVAVKIIYGNNNEHMKLLFYDDNDFLQHTSKLLQDTLYQESPLDIKPTDQLLVMQVCHYNPPNTYLLIICKKVP